MATKLTRLDRLARLGYFARAAVYAILGYIALTTNGLVREGAKGEFQFIRSIPGGQPVLLVLAAGLLAYSLYKIAGALLDIDRVGSGVGGWIKRAMLAIGGVAYLALGWLSLKFAIGWGSLEGHDEKQDAAAAILEIPLGYVVLALVGCGFLLAAAAQLRSALLSHFMDKLRSGAPPFTAMVGKIGLASRAIVFALIGWSVLRASWQQDERAVHDVGGALGSLHDSPSIYLAVALGVLVFSCYSAIEAHYRIVPPVDPVSEGKRRAAQLS